MFLSSKLSYTHHVSKLIVSVRDHDQFKKAKVLGVCRMFKPRPSSFHLPIDIMHIYLQILCAIRLLKALLLLVNAHNQLAPIKWTRFAQLLGLEWETAIVQRMIGPSLNTINRRIQDTNINILIT